MADPNDVSNYAVGGMAALGGGFWLLRWVIRTFHLDRAANKAADAEFNVIDRLQGEITRLEGVIAKQATQIAEMQAEQRKLEKRMSNQRAVLMAIETIVEGMCTCDSVARKKLAALIAELITDEGHEQCGCPPGQ